MELRHLRYFITVAEELNFSKAALRLYTAQPSLSQQIKDLEEEIGVRLFNRTKRKVELTEEGIVFLEQARLTISQAEKAVSMARQVQLSKQHTLRIGFITSAEIRILPKILPHFRVQYPNVKIELQILDDSKQHKSLKKDELDIIFSRLKVNEPKVIDQVIFKDELALILPKTHPLAALEKIPLSSLEGLDFIVPTAPSFNVMNQAVNTFIKQNHLKLKKTQNSTTIVDSLALINAGKGCSFLPKYVDPFSSLPNLSIKSLEKDLPTLDLIMSYKQENTSLALKSLLDMMETFFDLSHN
ncbi:LysR substrate-binding domain-containing protein [Acinetobacter nectaris]|uniref:LysR substrate-binding domain-containing protein n=1 Tax=Acinetobacter nectaris TaxID=1219382 RepID=UPI001F175B39|nr:LysR substrate-binding domain-containing protein [Acinetobacter nectaris]MCF9034469.1 LysR family transcriptional regulator [Acinetobacter nectaris]